MIKEQEILAERIIGYLRKNPNACDTTDGITTWWLGQGKTQPPVQQVANALDLLTKKGLIRKRQLHGGTNLYRSEVGSWQGWHPRPIRGQSEKGKRRRSDEKTRQAGNTL